MLGVEVDLNCRRDGVAVTGSWEGFHVEVDSVVGLGTRGQPLNGMGDATPEDTDDGELDDDDDDDDDEIGTPRPLLVVVVVVVIEVVESVGIDPVVVVVVVIVASPRLFGVVCHNTSSAHERT